jgi:hypothetical protein
LLVTPRAPRRRAPRVGPGSRARSGREGQSEALLAWLEGPDGPGDEALAACRFDRARDAAATREALLPMLRWFRETCAPRPPRRPGRGSQETRRSVRSKGVIVKLRPGGA